MKDATSNMRQSPLAWRRNLGPQEIVSGKNLTSDNTESLRLLPDKHSQFAPLKSPVSLITEVLDLP